MLKKITGMARYALGLKTPIKVAHYVTYRCNLHCDMCGRRAIESEQELTTEQVMDLQREFRKHGTIVWSFSGGECLVRKDIIELSKFAKELGMELIIVTNGILLPSKKDITKYADVIDISIDGTEETHDSVRGKGNYQRALRGLETLADARRKNLKKVINTILNNETIELHVLDHMLRLAKAHNCQVGFNPIIVHRSDLRGVVRKKYFPTNEQFNNFVKWLEENRRTKDGKYLIDNPKLFKAIGRYPDAPTRVRCYAGKFQLSIDPFGKVLPCSDFFDYEESYKREGLNWGYGYEGFRVLQKPVCNYEFCCTAKKNYFFAHPSQILEEYVLRKEVK